MGTKLFEQKLFIGGQWLTGAESREILSPYRGEAISKVAYASREQMIKAIEASAQCREASRRLSRFARSKLLAGIAQSIQERRADLVSRMVEEAGKPQFLSDVEVSRAVMTFTLASEEAKRFGGEVVPVDLDLGGRAYRPAVSYWIPRGPVLAITPFNFPLNLVAHKVAPALAVGAPVLLKPAPQAPGASAILAEIFEKAAKLASDSREAIPLSMFQVVNCANEVAALAVEDPRLSILSFTGSAKVGWQLNRNAVQKKMVLELGGNAAVIVAEDADLARAAARCAFGGYSYAGQVCISVQRVLVHESVEKKFVELLVAETAKIKHGDPADKEVLVGPVIDAAAAERIESWVEEARASGAKIVVGGTRKGALLAPTILTGVRKDLKLSCEEVFGPVVVVDTYRTEEEALQLVNDSKYGLQAGLFTNNARLIQKAIDEIEVGGLMINEIPTFRADNMPYGGLKESGVGREGVRYAMEDYCDRKTVVTWVG